MSIFLDGLTGKITGSTSTVPVGAFMSIMRATAPEGWVAGDGGTIGPVGSGATRANSDTQDLYFAWWADFTDAQLPILTVTGAASARGPSAMADWAAGKRMTVFDVRGRFPRVAGTINGLTFANGVKYADTFKIHNHLHSRIVGNQSGPTISNIGPGSGWSITDITSPTTDTGAAETAPVSIAMLGCFKL